MKNSISGRDNTKRIGTSDKYVQVRSSPDHRFLYYVLSIAITVCVLGIIVCTVFTMLLGSGAKTGNGSATEESGNISENSNEKKQETPLNFSEFILYTGFPVSHRSESETEAIETVTQDTLYDYDYSAVPAGATPVVPMDISLSSFGNDYIYNDTDYYPDVARIVAENSGAVPVYATADEPVVLIIHSHGTESYGDGSAYKYKDGDDCRSEDITENVVAVGEVLAQTLRQNGINTVHCTKMHDDVSYSAAYALSAKTVEEYLKKYPSIKYVFDIHRDSVDTAKGYCARAVCAVEGRAAAQIMAVIGSDSNGTDYDTWENNLSFAISLRRSLNSEYGNFCRPVYLKRKSYNQELAAVSVLFEIGTEGNTLQEACYSAQLLGKEISKIIKAK